MFDVIISEMEDTIVQGIRSYNLLARELDHGAHLSELMESIIEFLVYRMTSVATNARHGGPAERQSYRAGREVEAKTITEQDEAIRAIRHVELEQLDVQEDPTDSSDEDYQPIPQMPPCTHDHEPGGSSSTLAQSPSMDPALLAILEHQTNA